MRIISEQRAGKIILKATEQEGKYCSEDEKLYDVYAANAEDEYAWRKIFKEKNADSYFREL